MGETPARAATRRTPPFGVAFAYGLHHSQLIGTRLSCDAFGGWLRMVQFLEAGGLNAMEVWK